MSNKVFNIILISIAALGAALTVAHAVYAVYAFEHSSIIRFIAGELW